MWCACDKAPPPPIVLHVWDHSSPAYGSWLVTAALVSTMLHQKWPGKSEIPSLPSPPSSCPFPFPHVLSLLSPSLPFPLFLPPPSPLIISSLRHLLSPLLPLTYLFSSLFFHQAYHTYITQGSSWSCIARGVWSHRERSSHSYWMPVCVYASWANMSHMQLYPCSHGYEANALWLHCMCTVPGSRNDKCHTFFSFFFSFLLLSSGPMPEHFNSVQTHPTSGTT